eukprot:scaffold270006_cov19-Tisochrysis_lutea.AAC.1
MSSFSVDIDAAWLVRHAFDTAQACPLLASCMSIANLLSPLHLPIAHVCCCPCYLLQLQERWPPKTWTRKRGPAQRQPAVTHALTCSARMLLSLPPSTPFVSWLSARLERNPVDLPTAFPTAPSRRTGGSSDRLSVRVLSAGAEEACKGGVSGESAAGSPVGPVSA